MFYVMMVCVLAAQVASADSLAEAEAAARAARPAPSFIAPAPKLTLASEWFVGTSWGGVLEWHDSKATKQDGFWDWRSYVDSEFILTFMPENKCYILDARDPATKSVERLESTWKQEGDRVTVADIVGNKQIVFSLPKPAADQVLRDVRSQEWTGRGDKMRISLRKDWGLIATPPTVSYTGWRWSLSYKDCLYTRANP